MELKFVANKKPVTDDPIVQRRQRLVRRINQQIGLIQNANDGILPRTSWLWMDETGSYFLPIKYGRELIELKKGMFAVECDDVESSRRVFETVRSMVLDGALDEQLSSAAQDIRGRFKTGK